MIIVVCCLGNCNKSQLLDVVLTNNHVLVLTSSGLMISSHIGFTMENSTNQILNWTILADIFGCAKLLVRGARLYMCVCVCVCMHIDP